MRWLTNICVAVGSLCLVMISSCDTENNIASPDKNYFMKLYGGDGDQSGVDMVALDDGSFLLLGNSEFADVKKTYLVKVDSEGKILWERKYGNTTDVAKDIEPIGNGNFVILSTFINPTTDSTDIKLIRIQADGNKIDSVTYGTNKDDEAQTVTPLLDGGFIVAGFTRYNNLSPKVTDPANIFHYRCNANFQFDTGSWKNFNGALENIDVGNKVFQISTDQFLVFAYTNTIYPGKDNDNFHFEYYTLNESAVVGDPEYIGDSLDNIQSAFVSAVPAELGGGFLIIGTKTNGGNKRIFVSKLRSTLQFDSELDDLLGKELLIGNTILNGVSGTTSLGSPRGYLLLANETRTQGTNIWLAKIDQSAGQIWSVSLGSEESNDTASAVKELPDGKIVVLGTVEIRNNQTKMALFKLNSNGRLQN